MPWVEKRPAATPDTIDAPPAKRTAPSSPEEGEVDDGATPPKHQQQHDDVAMADAVSTSTHLPTTTLPAKPMATASAVKVPFPFKNKKPANAVALEEMKVDAAKHSYERADEMDTHSREDNGRHGHSRRSRSRDSRRG